MSYVNFIKAMKLAPKCKYFTTSGGKSQEEITKAEEKLNIKFSRQNLEFYERYGYLSFCGNEIFGIDVEDESEILEGNSVAYAINDRKEYKLPIDWLPIYNYDDGYMAYLDYSHKNVEGEPRVIIGIFTGNDYEILETIANDFGDFLLQLVEQEL